jgi:hypothetical protein
MRCPRVLRADVSPSFSSHCGVDHGHRSSRAYADPILLPLRPSAKACRMTAACPLMWEVSIRPFHFLDLFN